MYWEFVRSKKWQNHNQPPNNCRGASPACPRFLGVPADLHHEVMRVPAPEGTEPFRLPAHNKAKKMP
jgi:hypothetical protein